MVRQAADFLLPAASVAVALQRITDPTGPPEATVTVLPDADTLHPGLGLPVFDVHLIPLTWMRTGQTSVAVAVNDAGKSIAVIVAGALHNTLGAV